MILKIAALNWQNPLRSVDLTNVNHVSYNLMITQKANYKVKRR